MHGHPSNFLLTWSQRVCWGVITVAKKLDIAVSQLPASASHTMCLQSSQSERVVERLIRELSRVGACVCRVAVGARVCGLLKEQSKMAETCRATTWKVRELERASISTAIDA